MSETNGHAKKALVGIDCQLLGSDWVYFEGGQPTPTLEDLPGFLNRTLVAWFQERPQLKVRAVLPITSNGATVAIHVWFDGIPGGNSPSGATSQEGETKPSEGK